MSKKFTRFAPVQAKDRVAVIGAGRSGVAAVKLLLKKGATVRLIEKDAANVSTELRSIIDAAGGIVITGEHTPEHFMELDYIVPSPGMPVAKLRTLLPTHTDQSPQIIAEMELAWRYLQDEPVLAVTGTSGKTTTASVAAAMLKEQGYSVFLGGNIGTPLSEYILADRKADVLVLEISSFQLQTCQSFCPKVGVILNISENHLDYHKDMQEYIDAKFRLLRWQDEADVAVMHESLKSIAKMYGVKSRVVWFDKGEGRFAQTQLLGAHNASNTEAAWLAVREFGVSLDNAVKAVASFRSLPHRLEFAGTKQGVTYINDSKCTTVSSLRVALEAVDGRIYLLCGGKFKGGDLEGLSALVQSKVAHVALFGASREYFEKAWQGKVAMSWDANLAAAMSRVSAVAKTGDIVLLAPATASFDLYANYMERGNDFKRLVEAL